MPNIKTTKAAGLFTSDNPYGSTPEGSFSTADNVIIKNKDVVESRRGFGELGYDFSSSTARGEAIGLYGSTLVVNTLDGSTSQVVRDTGSAWQFFNSYTPPDSAALRMKFAEAQQCLYMTTSAGIRVMDSESGTIAGAVSIAGASRTPDAYVPASGSVLSGNPTASGSWLPKDSQVGYRATICKKDATGKITESAPSGRFLVINPGDVTVAIGGLVRLTNVVTATVTSHRFNVGDVFVLSANDGSAEANFPAGNKTVTDITSTTIKYSETAANATSTEAYTISSGTKKTTFDLYLPRGKLEQANHFLRIYRTEESAGDDIDPGDEHYLAYERFFTSTEISDAALAAFVDGTPPLALGAALYTNSNTGDGISQGNHQPPLAKDIATWQERLWFGNTTSKHRLEIQMLGVGSPDGVQIGDRVVIGGHAFWGVANRSDRYEFKVVSSFDAPTNVELTARSLVEAINNVENSDSSGISAFYIAAENEMPGRILIEESGLAGTSLALAASRVASWNPQPPTYTAVTEASSSRTGSTVTITTDSAHGFIAGQSITLATTTGGEVDTDFPVGTKIIVDTPTGSTFRYTEAGAADTLTASDYLVHSNDVVSSNDRAPNRIFYSKLQQPEAVPLVNYLDVGSKLSAILRICPLRDKLFVFKEDGIYTVSGEFPFRVDMLDNTAKLIAPDSVVAVSNRIFALTSQGVVSVTDGGVAILSRPIENDLLPLLTDTVAGFKAACFGVGYETDRSYMLWLPASSSSTTCTQAYVYNILANAWTRRTDAQTHAVVHPSSDKMYFCNASYDTLLRERKSFDGTDYAGRSFAINVEAWSSPVLTLSYNPSVVVGDLIHTAGGYGAVSAIAGNGVDHTIVGFSGSTFTIGAGTCYPAISCSLVYNPQTAGAPGIQKQFREHSLHFGKSDFDLGYMTSKTEVSESTTSDIIATSSTATTATPKTFRKLIPLEKQRAGQLQAGFTLRQAWSQWRLFGHSVEVDAMSERTTK